MNKNILFTPKSKQRFSKTNADLFWPLVMIIIRLPLAMTGSGIVIVAYQLTDNPVGIAAGLGWSTLTLTIVNLFCLVMLIWRGKVEGFDLWQSIGFSWSRLVRDTLWGMIWALMLGLLLIIGIFLTIFAIYGISGLNYFEDIFIGNANFSFTLPAWLVLISALVFPLLNPLVEELQYRGYGQPRLIAASGSVWFGTLVSAAGFGLQHMVFAVTLPAGIAYVFGFFSWGLGAGIIAHRQGRLIQLIVAHFISNLSFGAIPLFFLAGDSLNL